MLPVEALDFLRDPEKISGFEVHATFDFADHGRPPFHGPASWHPVSLSWKSRVHGRTRSIGTRLAGLPLPLLRSSHIRNRRQPQETVAHVTQPHFDPPALACGNSEAHTNYSNPSQSRNITTSTSDSETSTTSSKCRYVATIPPDC